MSNRHRDFKPEEGQQSNQNWDDENDKSSERTHEPTPERFSGGSAFNERHESTAGYGSSQQSEKDNAGPLDADLNDLPSEKRFGNNQSGPGLG